MIGSIQEEMSLLALFLDSHNFFVLSLFFLSLLLLLKLNKSSKLNLPPSPPKLPIIGHLHKLGVLPHRTLQVFSKKYGPVMLMQMGSAPTLVITSAEIAREILKTHDALFSNRVQTKAADSFYYGCTDVAFCPQGDYWRHVRKICVMELLSLKRVQSFRSIREEEAEEMVEKIRHSCQIGPSSVDVTKMLVDISTNIVSRAVLGRKFEVEAGKKSFGDFSKRAMILFGAFCFQDYFPYLGWMDVLTGLSANLKTTSAGLHAFLDQVIDERKISRLNNDHSERNDFVEILLRVQEDDMFGNVNLTQDNLKAILLDMFIGGTDTISVTMEWTLAELMRNPTIMKKAQEEVRRVVGKKQKVEDADTNDMEYLKCVIKETLRLYAIVPFSIPRESTASIKLEGYDIPPNTRVFINAWAIQRDPKLWDNPEEFVPERFINNTVDFKGQHFQFLPFGGGRRGCPGITFATTEAELVLANLLYWFDWELPCGITGKDMDMTEVYGMVISKKTPLELVPKLHWSF